MDDHWDSTCDGPDACLECTDTLPKPSENTTNTGHILNLVGFFDVHNPDELNTLKCGVLNIQGGFQNMLAFHYVFDRLLSTDKVTGLSIDTCGSSSRVHQGVLSLVSDKELCPTDDDDDDNGLSQSDIVAYLTVGNADTAAVMSLTGNGGVLTVSPSATASSFLELDHYLSMVPPDSIHAQIMSEVTRQMNWVYVSVIYSGDLIGQRNVERFVQYSKDPNQPVCVGFKLMLPQHATLEDAKALLNQLQTNNKGANVIILFVTDRERDLLLQAADELNLLGSYIFLGSGMSSEENVPVLPGSMNAEPVTYPLSDFYSWVQQLNVDNHGSVPDEWFSEYYPLYAGTLAPNAEVTISFLIFVLSLI